MKEILDENMNEEDAKTKGLVYFKYFMVFWYISMILIAISEWNIQARFHWGLVDMVYFIGVVGMIITIAMLHIKLIVNEDLSKRFKVFSFFCLAILIYFISQITIFRGGESRWDGQMVF